MHALFDVGARIFEEPKRPKLSQLPARNPCIFESSVLSLNPTSRQVIVVGSVCLYLLVSGLPIGHQLAHRAAISGAIGVPTNRDCLNKDWFAWGEEVQGYLYFREKQLNLGVTTKENPGRIGALCFFCSYVAHEINTCYFDFLQFDES